MPISKKHRAIQSKRGERLHIPGPGGYGPLPFSNGVLAGDTFFLSGHIGLDSVTRKPPSDAEQEARLMLDAFRETLSRANLTMNDLVYAQVFCSDVSLFEKFNSVYRTYFAEPFPARAFIGSGPLLFGARFEIQGIAVKSAKSQTKRRRR
jgi:2-iminobutanoate/2-iminopropanoate deaminase